MNIIQRNFFRMIRIGAFEQKEQIEPMSVYKWSQLYQLAVLHDVAGYVYEGLQRSKEQFFLHLTDKQWQLWERTVAEMRKKARRADEEPDEFLRADHLTNFWGTLMPFIISPAPGLFTDIVLVGETTAS